MTPQAIAKRAAITYRRMTKAGKAEPAECPYYILSTSRAECTTNMAAVVLRCEQAEIVLNPPKAKVVLQCAMRAVTTGEHMKCSWCPQ